MIKETKDHQDLRWEIIIFYVFCTRHGFLFCVLNYKNMYLFGIWHITTVIHYYLTGQFSNCGLRDLREFVCLLDFLELLSQSIFLKELYTRQVMDIMSLNLAVGLIFTNELGSVCLICYGLLPRKIIFLMIIYLCQTACKQQKSRAAN